MNKLRNTRLYRLGNQFTGKLNECHVSAYASSAAFFTFLSLIPLLLLFFTIIPYTPITEATIMKVVSQLLPTEFVPLSIGVITEMYHKKAALLSVSLLVTLWSSAKGMLALIRGLNVVNEVTERRNYFLLRLRACVYTIVMLVMFILLIVMVIFGERIMLLTTSVMPQLRFFFDFLIQIRAVFVIGVLVLFLWAVYTWLPYDLQKKRFVQNNKVPENGSEIRVRNRPLGELPGAVFTAFAWYLASWLFSEYVNRFSGFSTYGSMATVVIIMFWLYMCFYIIFVGAIMNAMLRNLFAHRRKKQKK